MIIQTMQPGREEQILRLYEAVGWTEYTRQPQRIRSAFDRSLCVLELSHEDQLLGFVRAVGDGETILYVQDLIVDPDYQNQGWGTLLLKTLCDRYPQVRQKILLSDDVEKIRHFYKKLGRVSVSDIHCAAWAKLLF